MGHQDQTTPKKGLTRRDLLKGGAAAGIAAALGSAGAGAVAAAGRAPQPEAAGAASAPNGGGGAELLLVNGKIHTMDAQNRVVSAVAIKNGRFVGVGPGTHATGPGTKVINLQGRTVIPGIIDNHNHIVLMGNRPGYHTPLENATSIADVQATYAARAAGIPAGAWITTIGGFHRNHLVPNSESPRMPTLTELDAACPNNPVYLTESFSGPSATNSLGKALFEAAPLPVPVGADGSIGSGTNATGRATLFLRQTLLNPEERRRATLDALAYGAGLGVTMHLDQGAFQKVDGPSDGAAHEDNYTMQLPFLEVQNEGKLNVRVRINFLHMDPELEVPTLTERLRNAFPFFGNDMLRTGGIGEFTAAGLGANWLEANRRIAQAGWRAEVHSLSRTDFQTEIQGYEAVNELYPITDLRWVVAHVPFITEDYVDRLKAIGGGLSLTGWRYLSGSDTNDGPPFRMIVDNGIPAGMSSDGMQIAPMNPWIHMYYAVTGINARGVLINDGQQISREEVLRLYTADNGWFMREEDQVGTIEPGKFGDLVVLNKDYFGVPDEEIKTVNSVLTVIDGKVVHSTGAI
jgi:hypothetical protein